MLAELKETYICDGHNSDCMGEIDYDDVKWFTSRIGLCPKCWEALHRTPHIILSSCYERCENDGSAGLINTVLELTK